MQNNSAHISFVKKNIHAFTITYSQKYILIEPQMKEIPTQLVIEKQTEKIVQQSRLKKFVFKQQTKTIQISLLLGILTILENNYIMYVNEVYFVGKMLDNSVYHIASVDFLNISGEKINEQVKKKTSEIMHQLQNQIFSFGFYFSFDYDLTLSYQQFIKGISTQEKYYWNEQIMKKFIEQGISNKWKLPIIQGYFGRFQSAFNSIKVEYFLVSRRSKYKSGTRFYSRGINDEGNCANFVQTEHLLKINDKIISHIMVRGSVPIFWQQRSMSSSVRLTRNKELTKIAFLNHYNELHKTYGRVLTINLLERSKSDEHLLTKAFEQLFSESYAQIWEFSRYLYFDLHHAVKANTPQKINIFIQKITNVLQTFSYFMYDLKKQTVICQQKGILRINCLDCLGRSGNLMHKAAFRMLEIILRQQDILLESSIFCKDVFKELNSQTKDCHPFTNLYKYIWADNADFLSKIYCGTESLSSNVTRLGKKSFFDIIDSSLLSLARLYNYKFEDKMKQKCLDIFLGHIKTSKQQITNINDAQSHKNTVPLKIFISTWNTNAADPKKTKIHPIIREAKNPDLIVFALQEMIPLNPNNVLNCEQDGQFSERWRHVLENEIGKLENKYIFIEKVELVGLWMAIYISSNMKNSLRGVQKQIVKTGLGGKFGNKGAVIIRIKVYETSICFTNCHLESGDKQLDMRVQTMVDIHDKAFQQDVKGVQNQAKIQFSDYKFLFGDLNFRINLPAQDVRNILKQMDQCYKNKQQKKAYKLLYDLIKQDQLTSTRRSAQCPLQVRAYNESPITFKPTYKFDKNSNQYALKKNRVPSWCDRILLWSEYSSRQGVYKSIMQMQDSDHKPVVTEYILQIPKKETLVLSNEVVKSGAGKEFRDSQFEFALL